MNSSPFNDERISAYLDGELSNEELAAFEKLLAEREDYRQAVEELRETSQAVRQLPREKLPTDFAKRVLRLAEQEMLVGKSAGTSKETLPRDQTTWARRLFWPIAVVAASLMFMLFAPDLMRPQVANVRTDAPAKSEPDTTKTEPMAAATAEQMSLEKRASGINAASDKSLDLDDRQIRKQEAIESDMEASDYFAIPSVELHSAPAANGAAAAPETVRPSMRMMRSAKDESLSLESAPSDSSVDNMPVNDAVANGLEFQSELEPESDLPIIEPENLRRRKSLLPYTKSEDYDAVTNLQLVDNSDIKLFYQSLTRNEITVDQSRALSIADSKRKLAELESAATTLNADKETKRQQDVQMVFVEAKPEKLQKVLDELSTLKCSSQVICNLNSPASERVKSLFDNTIPATPGLVEQQVRIMQDMQEKQSPTAWRPQTNELATDVETHSDNLEQHAFQAEGKECIAYCLGKVPDATATANGIAKLPAVTTLSRPVLPKAASTDMKKKRFSFRRTDPGASIKDAFQQSRQSDPAKPEQAERMRMLFFVREPDSDPSIIETGEAEKK